MSLSCIMIIKNGIKNGYPFLESIRSIVDVADEFLISDGYSEDETYAYLEVASKKFSNIRLYRDHWNISKHGEAIAVMTNMLKARARCDWVYNLQADEVIHESFLQSLRYLTQQKKDRYGSYGLKFLHFVGDFCHIETKPGYDVAVRLAPNNEGNFIADDGWTFRGGIEPIGVINQPPLFHFGWVYSKSNIFKRKNQAANIYMEQDSYQEDNKFCKEIEGQFDENPDAFYGWQRKMLSARKIRKYTGGYPMVVKQLLKNGNLTYMPDVRILELEIFNVVPEQIEVDGLVSPFNQAKD